MQFTELSYRPSALYRTSGIGVPAHHTRKLIPSVSGQVGTPLQTGPRSCCMTNNGKPQCHPRVHATSCGHKPSCVHTKDNEAHAQDRLEPYDQIASDLPPAALIQVNYPILRWPAPHGLP